MFTQNKYLVKYFRLIEFRQNNFPTSDNITEIHHIIPKSMGGSNKKQNLVTLTAREHYIAHKFLCRITNGDDLEKMIHAIWGMSNRCINNPKHQYLTSRKYESARKLYLTIAGNSTRGKTYEEIYGENLASELKRKRAESVSFHRKDKSWENIFGEDKAKWMRERVSAGAEKRRGKKLTQEQKDKISLSSRGKIYEKKPCPICSTPVSTNNLKRHINSHESNLKP